MKTKICKICNKEIHKNDNYIRLTDYKLGKFFDEGFYHNKCWHDRLNNVITRNQEKLKKMLPKIMERLKGGMVQ